MPLPTQISLLSNWAIFAVSRGDEVTQKLQTPFFDVLIFLDQKSEKATSREQLTKHIFRSHALKSDF